MSQEVDDFAAKIPLHFLLLGKTGHGKSDTGNSILGWRAFRSGDVNVAYAQRGQYDIKVVDGSGLEDANLTQTKDVEKACENMAKVLIMCNGGVHVFLLVIRFAEHFTAEDRKTLSGLKQIFGENYLKDHGIIVVTDGDKFPHYMKEKGTPNKSFTEWWQEQDEHIFTECSPRVVLFNNSVQNEEDKNSQRNELFQHAERLSKDKGLSTSEHFKVFADVRQEMIQQKHVPLLKEDMQRDVNILGGYLKNFTEKFTCQDVENVLTYVDYIHEKISLCEQSFSIELLSDQLGSIKKTIKELAGALNDEDFVKLKSLVDSLNYKPFGLEVIRQRPWSHMFRPEVLVAGSAATLAGSTTILGGAAAILGGTALAASGVSSSPLVPLGRATAPMGTFLLQYAAAYIEQQID